MKTKNNYILEGSIIKALLMISLPIIFANVLQTVYQLIDTFWVGRLGTEAVAAVSLSFPILFFLSSIAMGLTMAGSILVAQYNGKGNKEYVSLATGQTLSLVGIIAILISTVGYFSSNFLLSLMTNDSIVLIQATSYLQISFLGMLATFLYFIFQSSLRGIGEVKFPMYIILFTVILNFFLDPLFMFGYKFIPAMGVAGVAIATVITQTISATIGIIVLMRGTFNIKLKIRDLKLRLAWIKKIIRLGLPSSLEHSSRTFGMVIMTFLISTFGTLAVASYGIGTRILSFIIIPAIGLAISASTLVGNNLGAGNYERVKKITKIGGYIGFLSLTIIGIILFIFAKQISAFFVPGELELISMSTLFIRIMSLTFGLIGVQMVIIGAIKAAGRTTLAMLIAISQLIALFGFGIILSKLFNLGELGIWIAYPLSNVISFIVALFFYLKGEHLKNKVEHN